MAYAAAVSFSIAQPAAMQSNLYDSDEFIAHATQVDAAADLLRRHERILVLTGAGISTASGIPDYRDDDGIRRGRLPIQGTEFRATEAARKRYWARSMIGWPRLSSARPNASHLAVAQLEQAGKVSTVLTQNVDGLHQEAGSRSVIELHGSIHAVFCLSCQARYHRADIQQALQQANPALAAAAANIALLPDGDAQLEPDADTDFHIPACHQCGGVLQPDVVFFGDGVPAERSAHAQRAAESADAVLVIGTSLMVLSGFRFARMAAQAGKPVIAINRGVTRADPLLTLKIAASSEAVLPRLVMQVLGAAPE